MSWYEGTFLCGHDGYINLNGSAKMRRSMKEYRFSQLCPDCSRSEAIRFRQLKNIKSIEADHKMELPMLEGSARQITWATTLRLDICQRLEKYLENPVHLSSILKQYEQDSGIVVNLASDTPDVFFREVLYFLQNKMIHSIYWINNRYTDCHQIFLNALPDYIKWRDHQKLDFILEHFVASASLLSPTHVLHAGFVVIKTNGNEIRVYYEKNDIFYTLVKKHRFRWNGRYWYRHITEYSGTVSDRIAQLGNALLLAGFRISIDDPSIREKAVNADFLYEHSRWIMCGMTNTQFYIELTPDTPSWIRKNLMRIPNASYRYGSILIDVSHFEELEDFAQLYNYQFDQKAKQLLTQYKTLLAQARCVDPICSVQAEPSDPLRSILESSGSILSDLTDDEPPCD